MKFSKFVKSLAPDGGAIYEYMDERWLASPVRTYAHSRWYPQRDRIQQRENA